MKKSRYTDSQIISILKQAEAGTPVPDLCRARLIARCLADYGDCIGASNHVFFQP